MGWPGKVAGIGYRLTLEGKIYIQLIPSSLARIWGFHIFWPQSPLSQGSRTGPLSWSRAALAGLSLDFLELSPFCRPFAHRYVLQNSSMSPPPHPQAPSLSAWDFPEALLRVSVSQYGMILASMNQEGWLLCELRSRFMVGPSVRTGSPHIHQADFLGPVESPEFASHCKAQPGCLSLPPPPPASPPSPTLGWARGTHWWCPSQSPSSFSTSSCQ